MAHRDGYTPQENAVIEFAARHFRLKQETLTPETEVDGYVFARLVKQEFQCPTMLVAPRIRIRDIAGCIPPECLDNANKKRAAQDRAEAS